MYKFKERILKNKNIKIYGIYTFIFIIASIIIFYPFYKLNNGFIWQTDGYGQHFTIFYNFNEIIRNWLVGNQGLSTFSWNIGIGSDIIGEFSYYILGDPFAYISLLFPMEKLEFAYNFLVLFRMYFVGISFITYCKYHKKATYNTIIGAIIYTFCGYVLFASVRHPYFTNALIMLPIVFMGVDKILNEHKGKVFTFSIAIMAIMNYYFLYMVTILAVIYAIIKYFAEYKHKSFKDFGNKLFKASICYILGILTAAIILFPTIYAFLNSNRLSEVQYSYYNSDYYKNLIVGLISNTGDFWTRICISSVVILIMPISFYRLLKDKANKENIAIFINLIINIIMMLFVFVGSLMNGFSFQSNRWVFGFIFLLAYMVTINIDKTFKYSVRELDLSLIVMLFYYLMIAIMDILDIKYLLTSLAISAVMLILMIICNVKKLQKTKKIVPYLFTIVILGSIFNYSNQLYVTKEYATKFIENNKVMEMYNNYKKGLENFGDSIKMVKNSDNDFYRISDSRESNNTNMSLIYDYNSTNTYLSIGNKYLGQLCKDLIIRNYKDTNPMQKLDNRSKILEILTNKYYITNQKNIQYVPYGYKLNTEVKNTKNEGNNTQIYINENNLELGVFYDSYILKSNYDKLSPLEKEQALLDVAMLENDEKIKQYNINNNEKIIDTIKSKTTKECSYKIVDKDNIIKSKNKIKLTKKNRKLILELNENPENCELYLYIEGLKIKSDKSYEITTKYKNVSKKQTVQSSISNAYYVEMPGVLVNLGYKDVHKGTVEVSFSSKGTYEYNSIKLIAVPMSVYNESVNKLKATKFEITELNGNYIKGNINTKTSGILQLSTAYTKGFKAYVDGKETKTLNVNTAFIGVPLEAGEHEISFKYETPYLKEGIIVSLSTITIMAIYEFIKKKYVSKK